jgi:hypothetical protein
MKQKLIPILAGSAIALAFFTSASSARANVYASSIQVDGYLTNPVSASQGSTVAISYILNEPATAGVAVKILSGASVVRTISINSGNGTTKGKNSVLWDLKTDGGGVAAKGTYSVSVTAAATGYTNWTQISDDAAPSTYCALPRGLAVDNNTNSPYYGRIIIGNSFIGPGAATNAWGDVPGLYKVNADGSYSDDGAGRFGTAGYPFSGGNYYDGGDNPINMKIHEDDRLYFNNWVGDGEVVACDVLLTTNQVVLPADAYIGNPYYPGDNWKAFEVTDVLTDHARVYVCDANYPSAGIWYWNMTNGAANPADPNYTVGYQALATGGDVPLRCDGVAIDANTNVYVISTRGNVGDPTMRAACFTNWDSQTVLMSGAAWVTGKADDTFRNPYNLALDSVQHPHYLAVSMSSLTLGGIRVLDTADGSTVVSNLSVSSTYHSVCWDNVGNLYGGSQSAARWRVFSPPGTNQATTVALASVQVVTPVIITQGSVSGGQVTVAFTGDSADLPAAFTLQSSTVVTGPYTNDASATITKTSAGVFRATATTNGPAKFYRLKR